MGGKMYAQSTTFVVISCLWVNFSSTPIYLAFDQRDLRETYLPRTKYAWYLYEYRGNAAALFIQSTPNLFLQLNTQIHSPRLIFTTTTRMNHRRNAWLPADVHGRPHTMTAHRRLWQETTRFADCRLHMYTQCVRRNSWNTRQEMSQLWMIWVPGRTIPRRIGISSLTGRDETYSYVVLIFGTSDIRLI